MLRFVLLLCLLDVAYAATAMTVEATVGAGVKPGTELHESTPANNTLVIDITPAADHNDIQEFVITFPKTTALTAGTLVSTATSAESTQEAVRVTNAAGKITILPKNATEGTIFAVSQKITVTITGGLTLLAKRACDFDSILITPNKTPGATPAASDEASPYKVTLTTGVCKKCELTSGIKKLAKDTYCYCGPADQTNIKASTTADLCTGTVPMECHKSPVAAAEAATDTYTCKDPATTTKSGAQSVPTMFGAFVMCVLAMRFLK